MKKIPCYVRLHGSYKEIPTCDYESISAAKEATRYWNRPYTIVRLTPKMLLERHGFKVAGINNVLKKNDYVATISKSGAVNISKYTPNVKRQLWSVWYETVWELKKELEKNHN